MSNKNYTPTPWEIIGRNRISADNKVIVAVMSTGDFGFTDEDNANAAFIVRAVNSHEELVEALEYGIDWLSTQIEEEMDDSLPCIWIEKLRSALAKAKRD